MDFFKIRYLTVLLFACLLFSCSEDDPIVEQEVTCNDGIKNGDELGVDCGGSCFDTCFDEFNLEGFLVTRRILTSDTEYRLTGPYIIRDGAQLDIEAGTIIKAEPNSGAYIAVAQGGNIFVFGEEDNPVIMTSRSDNPQAGDWGGLVICGQAPTNNGINVRSDLADIFYGGTNPTSYSGTIRYLRLEYTGEAFRGLPFNALSLYGIGSTTSIQNIQAFETVGNAFEFIGGTVTASNLIALNSEASGVKVRGGWNGNGNNWFVSNTLAAGLELGNNLVLPASEPISNASISNITLNGPFDIAGISYSNGGGIFNLDHIYTSQLQLGIYIDSPDETAQIEEGNFNIDPIEFDNTVASFSPTNYSGNTVFYTEGISNGAGNRNNPPDWSQGWTIGF